jgi:hypothetical protein
VVKPVAGIVAPGTPKAPDDRDGEAAGPACSQSVRPANYNCLGYCKSEMKNPVAEVVRGFWRVGRAPAEIERLNWEYGPNWRLPFRETIDY